MKLADRLRILLPMSVGIILLDQLTKEWAIATLKSEPTSSFLGGILRLQYSENSGAFLSLGATLSSGTRFWLLNVAVGLGLLACLVFVLRTRKISRMHLYGFALLFSGGLSNLGDRAFRTGGSVVDFLNMGLGSLRTGIFNVADMAIMAGVFLVAWPRRQSGEAASGAPKAATRAAK